MKIMHAISNFGLGGSEQIAIGLAISHASRGHQCCVVTMAREESEHEIAKDCKSRLVEASVEIHDFGVLSPKFSALYVPFRLLRLIARWKPDIVHSHTDIPDFNVSLARRIRRFRVARTIHNTSLWPTHFLLGKLTESAFVDDLVISISNETKRAYAELRQRYGFRESPNQVLIPNGVETAAAAAGIDRSYLAREFGADPEKVLLCFAGRFDRQKGFDVLCDALSGLPVDDRKRLEVLAFGAGKLGHIYVQRARSESLPISFHPPLPRISRIFPAFDAVVIPSRFEGLPLVALEAISAGVPVVAATAPGLREALPPGWPLVFAPGIPSELTRLLVGFLNGRCDLTKTLSDAKTWALDKFGFEKMCDRYEAAYGSYLGLGISKDESQQPKKKSSQEQV